MRLFVAVDLPDDVREHLRSRTGPLRDAMPGWRWAPPERWHLTLAFLGQVADERVDELTRRMGLAARRHEPFDVRLGGVGAFSNARRAKVLWTGVEGDRDALKALADSVSAGARRAKIDVEERKYRPHVTLGRRHAPVDIRDSLGPGYESPPWRVEEFVLVESHLGSSVRHEVRERFPLGRHG